jgi:hypothetical protein
VNALRYFALIKKLIMRRINEMAFRKYYAAQILLPCDFSVIVKQVPVWRQMFL